MSLEEIIRGCSKNNLAHQKALYTLYAKTLFNLSLKYCKNTEEAQDNLHDSFIEIFTNIHKFKNSGSFEGWIKRITINKAIDSYKKSYQLVSVSDKTFPDTEIEEGELNSYSLEYLLSLIQELPNQYRLVFCLYELDEYPHSEIAQMLSISEGTSKSNLHRAKLILKEKIKSDTLHNTAIRYGK